MRLGHIYSTAVVAALLVGGASFFVVRREAAPRALMPDMALAARFDALSESGNSACSADFLYALDGMPDTARLQGSCCSPMDMHRYTEQVAGLRQYRHIPEIPPDPYDIDAGLAKKLKQYYDAPLTIEEQKAYDYAMTHSHEKGPCCCTCWRWYVYGGLGKLLIQKYRFTGEQLTEVWNLSDGCGGDHEHHHYPDEMPDTVQ